MCMKFGNDEVAAVKYMQGVGLLHRRRNCPRCGRAMVLQQRKDRGDVRWRCNRKQCQREISAKTGTWFQGVEQPVRTMLLFMWAWSEKLTTLNFCRPCST
uniref:Transposase zinc-ribbon domain-containing protein n=1 Tax=Trichuris muris TaxID=70415 RepID=A0A5S6Q105_TRIMR